MKVVINRDFGGFGLSDKAVRRLFELKGWKCLEKETKYSITFFYKDSIADENFFSERDLERNDSDLIKVIEELGIEANNPFSSLKIVEIPDDVKWHVSDYDGREHVAEDHRTWY